MREPHNPGMKLPARPWLSEIFLASLGPRRNLCPDR
jgi:hypothetical protein